MRVMVMVKASPESEAGVAEDMPAGAMDTYNDELVKAGVMLAGEGLLPSSRGVRVTWQPDGKLTRTDGPFTEAKDLVGGFTLVEARDIDQAVELSRGCPILEGGGSVEVRPVMKMDM